MIVLEIGPTGEISKILELLTCEKANSGKHISSK